MAGPDSNSSREILRFDMGMQQRRTVLALINRSAQGSITDTEARRHVPAILLVKLFLIMPETVLNVFGTMWAFCGDLIVCPYEGHFSRTVIEALVIFNWALFGLAIFGLALVFDPLGSSSYHEVQETPSAGESLRHRKVTSVWQRRFRWVFCWVRSDEHGHEAFQQVAALLSSLFRSTDLVPSDVLAGCVLLRVKQKKETREMRRIQMLADDDPKYTTDVNRIFSMAPRWMNLEEARHFLRLSMAAYGWPFVLYRYCATGIFRLLTEVTCCSCFRSKTTVVTDDNCCLCHLAGVKYISRIKEQNILFASFRNHVFELPFCVIADHKTSNIVIAIRGSISLRDVFTDLTATSERFEADGLPPDAMAHKGMMFGARYIYRRLKEAGIVDKALILYPEYGLVLTGHSLGAGVAALLAIIMRPKYPDLKVYAFSAPAGVLSREAARVTESFVFTVGVGDDFVMRMGVDSIENVRTGIIQTLHASRLPKYRILLNGFGYALFGVPPGDLESTWKNDDLENTPGTSPLLSRRPVPTVAASTEAALLSRHIGVRRFSKTRLFTPGKILHIVSRKKTKAERKAGTGGPSFEMRWATAEDFMEFKIMPKMLVDHLPENVYKTLDTILVEQKNNASEII
ncbi:hypothetical protein Trydic_g18105 [Trypoxylus dichotomus]